MLTSGKPANHSKKGADGILPYLSPLLQESRLIMEYTRKKVRKDPLGNILEKGEQYEDPFFVFQKSFEMKGRY